MQADKKYFKVIQITDTHLFENAESTLFGLSSNNHFDIAINEIKKSELHDTDAIFLTGDLSQDETAQSYSYLLNHIQVLNKPVYWIPGNHDALNTMQDVFDKSSIFQRGTKLSTCFWDFIFINTKIDGHDYGYISHDELERLCMEIKSSSKKTAIVMHHHPTFVNTPLIDKYILENRDTLWGALKNFNVDLIICGHVHNDYSFSFNNVPIEASPATCLQWKKGTSDLVLERKTGFKVYYFWKNTYETKLTMLDV